MSGNTTNKKIIRKILASILGLIGVAASVVALIQYYEEHPSNNISGEWTLINTIQQTTYRPYKGLRLSYKLFLSQEGNKFSGNGEKDKENERYLDLIGRSPIKITGTINGSEVKATFNEQGLRRKTSGIFIWNIRSSGDTMIGRFSHSAANASGSSIVFRIPK
jgi:hypothetical protein